MAVLRKLAKANAATARTACVARGAWRVVSPLRAAERSAFDERSQSFRVHRVRELTQRLGLDLPNALAGERELLADFFEGMLGLLFDSEPHAQNFLLAWGQRLEKLLRLRRQIGVEHHVGGRG